jgi:hypothetical protein
MMKDVLKRLGAHGDRTFGKKADAVMIGLGFPLLIKGEAWEG